MQKIAPFLWFDGKAEEAAKFYTLILGNSKITSVTHGPNSMVMSVTFQLEGQDFFALNGCPHFTFSQAISFFVKCETQGEVDALWEKLSAGGEKQRCGWLKDKFEVSWQALPAALGRLLHDPDRAKSQAVMSAMMKMDKIDIARLEQVHARA